MIDQVLELQRHLYSNILTLDKHGKLPQDKLVEFQTSIFRCSVASDLEQLKNQYLEHVKTFTGIIEEVDLQDPQLVKVNTLLKIVYYLGVFLNNERNRLFDTALAIIREGLANIHRVVYHSEYLDLIKACGATNLKIQNTDCGFTYISNSDKNEYFEQMFLIPYVQKLKANLPENQIIEYLQEERKKISLLHKQSESQVMNELIKHVIQLQLSKMDYEDTHNAKTIYKVFKYLEVPDTTEYVPFKRLKKPSNEDINPMLELALHYKVYLKRRKTDFEGLVDLFEREKERIRTIFEEQKQLWIVLQEYVEENLVQDDYSRQICVSRNMESVAQMVSFGNYQLDFVLRGFLHRLMHLVVTPFEQEINLEEDEAKIKKLLEHQKTGASRKKVLELAGLFEQALGQKDKEALVLKRPIYQPADIELIEDVPQVLLPLLPKVESGRRLMLSHHGYALVGYKKEYTLVMNTITLVTLLNLEAKVETALHGDTMSRLTEWGLVVDGKLNEDWVPASKVAVLMDP